MLYFSSACDAQSTASCCISSLISAFFITALRSAMVMIGWVKISRRLRSSVSSASPSEMRVTAASMASLSTACYCATAAGLLLLLLFHYTTASATALLLKQEILKLETVGYWAQFSTSTFNVGISNESRAPLNSYPPLNNGQMIRESSLIRSAPWLVKCFVAYILGLDKYHHGRVKST